MKIRNLFFLAAAALFLLACIGWPPWAGTTAAGLLALSVGFLVWDAAGSLALLLCLLPSIAAASEFAWDSPPPAKQLRLVSAEKHAAYLKLWPNTDDPWLLDLKRRAVFYDDAAVPPAYQDWDSSDAKGPMYGVHSPFYNVSAAKFLSVNPEPHGNANREFPWGTPAGLHRSPSFKAVRFFSLPPGGKIQWWREQLPRDVGKTYIWEFPSGTTFGEMLLVTSPGGQDYAFEVRTRTKKKRGSWAIDVFRPVRNLVEYRTLLTSYVPGYRWTASIQDSHGVFKSEAVVHQLEPIPEQAVVAILERPFSSVLGEVWDEAGGVECHAPTTEAAFHVVPKNYKGGFIEVGSRSCMTCHDTTLKHAKDFDEPREWYGRVRGSDNIFTFHPFDPVSISTNGHPKPVVLNKHLPLEEVSPPEEDRTTDGILSRLRARAQARRATTTTVTYSAMPMYSAPAVMYSAPMMMRSYSAPMMRRAPVMMSRGRSGGC